MKCDKAFLNATIDRLQILLLCFKMLDVENAVKYRDVRVRLVQDRNKNLSQQSNICRRQKTHLY